MPDSDFLFVGMILAIVAAGIAGLVLLLYFRLKGLKKWQAALVAIAIVILFWSALFLTERHNEVTRQDNDIARFEEIFGFPAPVGESQMLSNHRGERSARMIFMRVYLTDAQKLKILSLPNIRTSSMTMENIIVSGNARGFRWWIEKPSKSSHQTCADGEIYEVTDYNNWRSITLIDCPYINALKKNEILLDQGSTLYIIADGRRK